MTLSRSANTHLSETRVHWDGLSRPESANLQRTTKAIALSTKAVCMPVFGIDLAAARAPQCARQDKPEQTCRAWYKSPVWKAIKRHRLSQEPNCRQCAQEGCLIHGDARCSCRASWRSVVAIYGLCEHAKPVLLAPQRPETTSVMGSLTSGSYCAASDAVCIAQR